MPPLHNQHITECYKWEGQCAVENFTEDLEKYSRIILIQILKQYEKSVWVGWSR
jgi:hypothetical protein